MLVVLCELGSVGVAKLFWVHNVLSDYIALVMTIANPFLFGIRNSPLRLFSLGGFQSFALRTSGFRSCDLSAV